MIRDCYRATHTHDAINKRRSADKRLAQNEEGRRRNTTNFRQTRLNFVVRRRCGTRYEACTHTPIHCAMSIQKDCGKALQLSNFSRANGGRRQNPTPSVKFFPVKFITPQVRWLRYHCENQTWRGFCKAQCRMSVRG